MKFQGAKIKEQGVTFAIVVVQMYVIQNQSESRQTIVSFKRVFGNIPIVLMAQDSLGRATYFGRDDIVKFLADLTLSAIPWQEYTLN